jgi:hypothetical protein
MIDSTNTLNSAVRAAIDAHQTAWKAIQQLGDDVDDITLDSISRIESDAMKALAKAPCRDDEDFHLMLEYLVPFLLKREKDPSAHDGYGALAIVWRSYF